MINLLSPNKNTFAQKWVRSCRLSNEHILKNANIRIHDCLLDFVRLFRVTALINLVQHFDKSTNFNPFAQKCAIYYPVLAYGLELTANS
jgi:hypothetical protein